MTAGAPRPVVDAAELDRRVIEPTDFVADREAFVDVRLARSAGKASYSFVGPGVSQNASQVVNLTVPHGYCIGAASMPHGVVNNQHLHYTAEVFICTRGRWRMFVGEQREQELEIGPGTVFSVPTWVFRGFENIGDDDGWLFTVLGGDDTGGIIWAPEVLREAASTGLYLAPDHSVIDARAGQSADHAVRPLSPEALAAVDRYSDEELAAHVVELDDVAWSERALLSSVVPGHDCGLAPVIGFGMSEDRRQRPPLWHPHGFTVEWLRVGPGQRFGRHRIQQTQVLLLCGGSWEVVVDGDVGPHRRAPADGSVVSVPPGAWRDFVNTGEDDATALVVCGTDERARIQWDPELVAAAGDAGWALDANGYLASVDLLGRAAS